MPRRSESQEPVIRVFVGSSSTSIKLAREIKSALLLLAPQAALTIWDEAFDPGQLLLDQILGLVKEYDFGIFVFAPDDVQVIRGNRGGRTEMTVRDNVLFEAGVFMGGLGHERTFLVRPRGFGKSLRTPSDLEGLLTADYNPKDKRDPVVSVAALRIAKAITKLGPAPRNDYDEVLALRRTLDQCEFKDGKRRVVVLGDMVALAARSRKREWHVRVDPRDLMAPILKSWGNAATDSAYWWLVVHGVFRFWDIENFTSEAGWGWDESIEYVEVSLRGAALLNQLQKESAGLQ